MASKSKSKGPATETIPIEVAGVRLEGDLTCPAAAKGLVIFAHGSGSSRLSPRNRQVAEVLQAAGFATLLFDLLTEEEDETYENRFDIPLLAERLIEVVAWARRQPGIDGLPFGLFGASTGAAAALEAAAKLGPDTKAVVSRGGRPDLAGENLAAVKAPTLLIVGGLDDEVIALNRQALDRMICIKELTIVPGATHLFEEPGTLEKVSDLARFWFERYLV